MAQTLLTVSQRRILYLRDRYIKELEQDDDPIHLRERLAAMAHALQMTLCLPSSRRAAPHAATLEVLMRAVAHDIEGGLRSASYVREKARIGYGGLLADLDEDARGNWTLQGYDTFEGAFYSLDGVYGSKEEAEKAARERLAQLEESQPTKTSGGQNGIQDQVYIVSPGGEQQRVR